MIITSSDIKIIINNYMPRGQWVHISDIQDLIRRNYSLTNADWEPHTNSRPTTYPVWKHKLQGVLSGMKSAGTIQHDKNANSYMI